MTDTLSGADPSSVNFAVVDSDGTVQPSGPVTLGAGGTYLFTVLLQASRQGTDLNGIQYTATVSAKDLAGNAGSASTVVTVAHDQSN